MADILKKDMSVLWAATGDIVAPDDTKISDGWAVEVVPRQWWNWMQNRVDTNVAYALQKGLPEWDALTEYIGGKSYVQYAGVLYKSILTGTNQIPPSAPTYWVKAVIESTASGEALKTLTPAADTMPYFTGATTAASTALTPFARTLLDDADAATARTTLNAQTLNTALTAISGVTPAANQLPYFTGATTAAITTLSAFIRTLLDDGDAATARATLGANDATNLTTGTVDDARLPATITSDITGNAATATALQTARTINGTSFNGTANITLSTVNLSGAQSIAGIKTFTDGVVSPTFTGDLVGKLATARNIALGGDVTGNANFDGSANITITAAVVDDSHNHTFTTITGLQTALDQRVPQDTTVGAAQLPAGTTAQRPSGVEGKLRYNTDLDQFEGYSAAGWGTVGGGATGAPGNYVFNLNDQIVTGDFTVPAGKNAGSFGPITVANGVTVTISNGSTWSIV